MEPDLRQTIIWKNAFINRCQGVYLFIYRATDGGIMCRCRDVIYRFCLVRSLFS